jgi:hypothetical protein
VTTIQDAPMEFQVAVYEFFPEAEWDHCAQVAELESKFDAFALDNTVDDQHPCGSIIRVIDGVDVSAERSVGYFQINSCNFPDWEWQRLYNARHNVGTAHLIWSQQGWKAWFFSAQKLGLG